MAVITVTYARLWNLGNYENERLEAVATVESDATSAFAEAVQAVTDQHALMQAERDEAEEKRQAEYEAERQRRREERETTKAKAANTDLF